MMRYAMALGLAMGCAGWLVGCGSDDGDSDPIVGSGNVTDLEVDAMFVETVRISMPFTAVVHNGEERKVIVEGEDNLIAHITIEETDMSAWEISAPHTLNFEQTEDIVIRIPFIDMVEISIDGDISFADDPIRVWNEQEGEMPESGG